MPGKWHSSQPDISFTKCVHMALCTAACTAVSMSKALYSMVMSSKASMPVLFRCKPLLRMMPWRRAWRLPSNAKPTVRPAQRARIN